MAGSGFACFSDISSASLSAFISAILSRISGEGCLTSVIAVKPAPASKPFDEDIFNVSALGSLYGIAVHCDHPGDVTKIQPAKMFHSNTAKGVKTSASIDHHSILDVFLFPGNRVSSHPISIPDHFLCLRKDTLILSSPKIFPSLYYQPPEPFAGREFAADPFHAFPVKSLSR